MLNTLSFQFGKTNGGALSVTPCIDGTPLTDLISDFEKSSGHTDPTGGYGGLVPAYFNYGPLERYFCGQGGGDSESGNAGEIYVLGCKCGEVGCWPLVATVTRVDAGYKWAGFNQPRRPKRNYEAFGPFVFERVQYENALREAALRSRPEC